MISEKGPCLTCECWDPNAERCAIPCDRWYAYPIDYENPEYQKRLEEMIDELLFIEKLNSKYGKKVD